MRVILSMMLALVLGCSNTADQLAWPEYQEWLKENAELIIKEKHINQLTLKAEYMPADLLAYQEYEESKSSANTTLFDSLRNQYVCGLSFKLSIIADNKGANLMYTGISTMEEYKHRVNVLNFNNEEFLALTIGGEKYKPALSLFEGYNELSNRLTFNVVFTPKEFDCGVFEKDVDELTFTFEDPYWNTGVNHFLFRKTDLENIPKLIKAN